MGAAEGVDAIIEQVRQHDIDHAGACLGDLEPGLARIVMHVDHRALQPQESLAGGQTRHNGHVPLEVQPL